MSHPSEAASLRAALRELGPLREFTDGELDTLIAVAPVRRFAAGELLCREGTAGASCFVLVSGEVEIRKAFGTTERVVATLRAGAVVGQMALVDHGKRSASARSVGVTVTLELERDVFERLLHSESPLALRFQEQVAVAGIRQLRMATERLVLLRSEGARLQAGSPGAGSPAAGSPAAGSPAAGSPAAGPRPTQASSAEPRIPAPRESWADLQAATGEWAVSLDDVDYVPEQPRRGHR